MVPGTAKRAPKPGLPASPFPTSLRGAPVALERPRGHLEAWAKAGLVSVIRIHVMQFGMKTLCFTAFLYRAAVYRSHFGKGTPRVRAGVVLADLRGGTAPGFQPDEFGTAATASLFAAVAVGAPPDPVARCRHTFFGTGRMVYRTLAGGVPAGTGREPNKPAGPAPFSLQALGTCATGPACPAFPGIQENTTPIFHRRGALATRRMAVFQSFATGER